MSVIPINQKAISTQPYDFDWSPHHNAAGNCHEMWTKRATQGLFY